MFALVDQKQLGAILPVAVWWISVGYDAVLGIEYQKSGGMPRSPSRLQERAEVGTRAPLGALARTMS